MIGDEMLAASTVLGAVLIVTGVALWNIPASVVVSGLMLLVTGLYYQKDGHENH